MCLSNAQAYRCILWTKHVYHKYNLNHVLLLSTYLAFIVVAAATFFMIESSNSDTFRSKWQKQLSRDRSRFINKELLPEIFNNTKLLLYIHDQKSQYLTAIMNYRLQHYENQLKLRPPMPTLPCTFANSLLFVFSTITTIGYGYIYPVTREGRILSIVISLAGIPFTIIVIKDLAYLLAQMLNYPCALLDKLWAMFRFCTLRPADETELERKLHVDHDGSKDYRLQNSERLLAIPVTVAIFATVGWISLGCFIVHMYMPHLETSVAVYFIFNSLATIGVGDVEPGKSPMALLILFVYLLIGLSIVSLFINLLHTKFSKAYWMPGKLYIPLRPQSSRTGIASFDSYDEMTINDCALNHFTTLGVIQADDKCQLLDANRREKAQIEARTQTENQDNLPNLQTLGRIASPDPVRLPYPHTSHEDVNSLIVETYGARPVRLIYPISKD